jgi:error-prone DNA polymerase
VGLQRSSPDVRGPARVGFRLVQGLGEEEGQRIVTAREESPFQSVADVARRTGLDRGALEELADADAFRALGVERRRALWEIQGLWTGLPLLAGLSRREPAANLPTEAPYDALRADLRAVGLSVDRHPLQFFRAGLDRQGAVPIDRVRTMSPGSAVRIGGLVQNRQRPGTANGVVFMTLEDETAMVNLVIWPRTWSTFRTLARNRSLLGVDGRVQRQDDAVSVLVDRFFPLEEEPTLELPSRDFH